MTIISDIHAIVLAGKVPFPDVIMMNPAALAKGIAQDIERGPTAPLVFVPDRDRPGCFKFHNMTPIQIVDDITGWALCNFRDHIWQVAPIGTDAATVCEYELHTRTGFIVTHKSDTL